MQVTLKGLESHFKKELPHADLVGFDIFDTVIRRIVEPEWIKRSVSFGVLKRMGSNRFGSPENAAKKLHQQRLLIEDEVARERLNAGGDLEANFDEVMRRWVAQIHPSAGDIEYLLTFAKELELSLEIDALRRIEPVCEQLKLLAAAGKRVIAVSDMYFNCDQVRRLLASLGVADCFHKIYVSNDTGLRKASGRLFDYVLAQEKVNPERFLFMGDHPISDLKMPREKGIRAFQLFDRKEELRRRRISFDRMLYERNSYWSYYFLGRLLGEISTESGEINETSVGKSLAPVLTIFIDSLIEQLVTQNIDHVYFLAREGLVLQKIFRVLQNSDRFKRKLPKAAYLHVSRRALFLPSLESLDLKGLKPLFDSYSRQTLREFLLNLSLPIEKCARVAEDYGLSLESVIEKPHQHPALSAWLQDCRMQELFVQERDLARRKLQKYLAQRGFFNARKVALVDVGWKGSIQDYLVRSCEGIGYCPDVYGYYLGLVFNESNLKNSFKSGLVTDTRRFLPEELDLFRNSSVFEMLTTANHGTTVGYESSEKSNDLVVPVFLQHRQEKLMSEGFFVKEQNLLYEFAEKYSRVRYLCPFESEKMKPGMLDALGRYIRFPTRAEAEEFIRYSHVESFGVHEITTYEFKKNPLNYFISFNPWRALKRLFSDIRRNPWGESVIRRSRVPGLSIVYDLYIAVKM
jgi:predicted HAD superfamily hydrolase